MLTVFGAVSQLEREYLKDRQMKGIAIAVTAGKYKGRKYIEVPKLWVRVIQRRDKLNQYST